MFNKKIILGCFFKFKKCGIFNKKIVKQKKCKTEKKK